jgi:hypothetical protein
MFRWIAVPAIKVLANKSGAETNDNMKIVPCLITFLLNCRKLFLPELVDVGHLVQALR